MSRVTHSCVTPSHVTLTFFSSSVQITHIPQVSTKSIKVKDTFSVLKKEEEEGEGEEKKKKMMMMKFVKVQFSIDFYSVTIQPILMKFGI